MNLPGSPRFERGRRSPPIDQPVITSAKVVTSCLRVAAVHAERVQLENLAREILVDARPAAPCCRRASNRAARELGPTDR